MQVLSSSALKKHNEMCILERIGIFIIEIFYFDKINIYQMYKNTLLKKQYTHWTVYKHSGYLVILLRVFEHIENIEHIMARKLHL